MTGSSYAEITAAIDRAYAAPADEPLPLDQVFASPPPPVDPQAGPEGSHTGARLGPPLELNVAVPATIGPARCPCP
jgi:hypothetical protein